MSFSNVIPFWILEYGDYKDRCKALNKKPIDPMYFRDHKYEMLDGFFGTEEEKD